MKIKHTLNGTEIVLEHLPPVINFKPSIQYESPLKDRILNAGLALVIYAFGIFVYYLLSEIL